MTGRLRKCRSGQFLKADPMPEITAASPVPVTIQLPPSLGIPLLKAATKSKRTIQAEILSRLGESLGKTVDMPVRGRKKGSKFPDGYKKNPE